MTKNWRISGRLVSSFVMKYGSNGNLKKNATNPCFFLYYASRQTVPLKTNKANLVVINSRIGWRRDEKELARVIMMIKMLSHNTAVSFHIFTHLVRTIFGFYSIYTRICYHSLKFITLHLLINKVQIVSLQHFLRCRVLNVDYVLLSL